MSDLAVRKGRVNMREDYKIDVLIFGTAGLPADWVYNGKFMQGELTANSFGVTALRKDGKVILIDTGSNMNDAGKLATFEMLQAGDTMDDILDALALAGISPEDVTDVVLTHAHMDHIGALELFPNAHFYIQRAELEAWEDIASNPKMAPMLMPAVADENDLKRARALVEEGRMTLLDGDVEELLPGIDVFAMHNCHSVCDQIVVVHTPDGDYVDVGDLVTREAHIMGIPGAADHYLWQSGCAGSEYQTMMAYPRIMELVDNDISHVIMRHSFGGENFHVATAQSGNAARYQLR